MGLLGLTGWMELKGSMGLLEPMETMASKELKVQIHQNRDGLQEKVMGGELDGGS